MDNIGEVQVGGSNMDLLIKQINNKAISNYADIGKNKAPNQDLQIQGETLDDYSSNLSTATNEKFQLTGWFSTNNNSRGAQLEHFHFISGEPYLNPEVTPDGINTSISFNGDEYVEISLNYQVVQDVGFGAIVQTTDPIGMHVQVAGVDVDTSSNTLPNTDSIFNVFAITKPTSGIRNVKFLPTNTTPGYFIRLISVSVTPATTPRAYREQSPITHKNGFPMINGNMLTNERVLLIGDSFNSDYNKFSDIPLDSGAIRNRRLVLVGDVTETSTSDITLYNTTIDCGGHRITASTMSLSLSEVSVNDMVFTGKLSLSGSNSKIHIHDMTTESSGSAITTNLYGCSLDVEDLTSIGITNQIQMINVYYSDISLRKSRSTYDGGTVVVVDGRMYDSRLSLYDVNVTASHAEAFNITGNNNHISVNNIQTGITESVINGQHNIVDTPTTTVPIGSDNSIRSYHPLTVTSYQAGLNQSLYSTHVDYDVLSTSMYKIPSSGAVKNGLDSLAVDVNTMKTELYAKVLELSRSPFQNMNYAYSDGDGSQAVIPRDGGSGYYCIINAINVTSPPHEQYHIHSNSTFITINYNNVRSFRFPSMGYYRVTLNISAILPIDVGSGNYVLPMIYIKHSDGVTPPNEIEYAKTELSSDKINDSTRFSGSITTIFKVMNSTDIVSFLYREVAVPSPNTPLNITSANYTIEKISTYDIESGDV